MCISHCFVHSFIFHPEYFSTRTPTWFPYTFVKILRWEEISQNIHCFIFRLDVQKSSFYTQLSCWWPIKGVLIVITSRWWNAGFVTGNNDETGDTNGGDFNVAFWGYAFLEWSICAYIVGSSLIFWCSSWLIPFLHVAKVLGRARESSAYVTSLFFWNGKCDCWNICIKLIGKY